MTFAALQKILDDGIELIRLTRKGVEYSLFNAIVTSGPFSMKDWSLYLHLTERTLQRYKKEDDAFKPSYIKILEAGGSKSPADILSESGIDISSKDFWQGGFNVVDEQIKQLEAIEIPS